MSTLSFTQVPLITRCHLDFLNKSSLNLVQLQGLRLHRKSWSLAVSKKISPEKSSVDASIEEEVVKKKTPKTAKRNGKKTVSDDDPLSDGADSKKTRRKTAKKAASSAPVRSEGDQTEKKVRKKITNKKVGDVEKQVSQGELSESEEFTFIFSEKDENEEDLELELDDGKDISETYGWPPLVCCFGAAQYAFVPSGIHERNKDAYWPPEKCVRSPGGSAGSVALALASLGGKVALMGKLGNDNFGQAVLNYMNANNVQTRAVKIDSGRATAVSQMKIGKKSRLRLTGVEPCAEDFLSKSEINIDVLKEAKMFYFNTHSLLDQNMRSTTMRAIRISKKLGGVVFYDVNLPLPLWQSSEETKLFIQQVCYLSDIIEVTSQELEFLCGIQPQNFDTKNNDRSQFDHYNPEVFAPLWHGGLKVLFVTNGTSIHYYTKDHNGAISGMENPLVTPSASGRLTSGDGIVAALLRMLTVQLHGITDPVCLERTIRYAIDCVNDWLEMQMA